MAPAYLAAATQQAPLRTKAATKAAAPADTPEDHSPEALAKRMVWYNDLFCAASDVIRGQPERERAISQELQNKGQEVPLGTKNMPDPLDALKHYDSKLKETPVTFIDHYYHFVYSVSASITLDTSVIGPLAKKDRTFFDEYHKIYMKLYNESMETWNVSYTSTPPIANTNPSGLSSSRSLPRGANTSLLLSLKQAEGILETSNKVLMSKGFYTLGGGDPDEAGEWKVEEVISRRNDDEYMIRFDGLDTLIPHSREELIVLLTGSFQM